jgi:hypothetical protein
MPFSTRSKSASTSLYALFDALADRAKALEAGHRKHGEAAEASESEPNPDRLTRRDLGVAGTGITGRRGPGRRCCWGGRGLNAVQCGRVFPYE